MADFKMADSRKADPRWQITRWPLQKDVNIALDNQPNSASPPSG
jgi:hypothetical protein